MAWTVDGDTEGKREDAGVARIHGVFPGVFLTPGA